MALFKRFAILIVLFLIGHAPAAAQEVLFVSLEAPTTALQTGQEYEVTLRMSGANAVWLLNVEVEYDPDLLFIFGTQSGSPVRQGAMFDRERSVVVRNNIQRTKLNYTVSMLAPADPVSGDGAVGTFRIYPLKAGTTTLRFSRAEAVRVHFSGEGEQRTAGEQETLSVSPVLLELTISGDPVEPPSEATATPAPTETPNPSLGRPVGSGPTEEATLANVTAAPSTPEVASGPASEAASSLPLVLAVIVMVVGGLGSLALLVVWLRRRR